MMTKLNKRRWVGHMARRGEEEIRRGFWRGKLRDMVLLEGFDEILIILMGHQKVRWG
jgi:hypothetical protein